MWRLLERPRSAARMSPRAAPGPPATEAELADTRSVLAAAPKAMSTVRSAATKWQAGLAGLSAVTAVFGLVKGRDDVSALSAPWAGLYGVALAIGFGLSVAAGICAMRAAYGLPVITKTKDWHFRSSNLSDALTSARFLLRAIWLTVASFGALAVAVGTAWYAPQTTAPSIEVHTSSGIYCGSDNSLTHGVLSLQTAGGAVAIVLSRADQLQAVSSCPAG